MVVLSMMLVSAFLVLIANERKFYVLLGLALGTGLQFEVAGGLFSFVAVFLALLLIKPFKVKLSDYFKIFLCFFITLIPRIMFEFRHGFLMTNIVFLILITFIMILSQNME